MSNTTKPISVRNLRATAIDAVSKIKSDETLSEADKSFLVSKIEKSGFQGVIVDAHEAFDNGATHFHASIVKLFAFGLIALFSVEISALAGITSSNMVTYATTSGASTNNGVPILIGQAYLPTSPNFVISDGGTLTTNAFTVYIQYGLDTNYYATVATYTKPTTNATDGVVTPGGIKINVFAQTKIVTTNAVTIGTKLITEQ